MPKTTSDATGVVYNMRLDRSLPLNCVYTVTAKDTWPEQTRKVVVTRYAIEMKNN